MSNNNEDYEKEESNMETVTNKVVYGEWMKLSQILKTHIDKKGNTVEDVRKYLKDIRKGK